MSTEVNVSVLDDANTWHHVLPVPIVTRLGRKGINLYCRQAYLMLPKILTTMYVGYAQLNKPHNRRQMSNAPKHKLLYVYSL